MKRYRLSMMLIIPFLFVLYFSMTVLKDKFHLVNEMGVIEDLMTLTVKMSTLIHELQRERGMSAGLLGSQGQQFRNEIAAQRQRTDQRITDVRQLIEKLGYSFSETLNRVVHTALQGLAQIDQKRQSVDGLKIQAKEAIDYYSNLNAALLEVIPYIIKRTNDGNIATQAVAYLGLLQSKEKAGIERAILSNTFTRQEFAPGLYHQFIATVDAQDVYTGLFLSLADDEQKAFYQETMKGQFIEETARLRRIALERDETQLREVDAGHWFTVQTGKIDLLKKVEDHLAENLVNRTSALGVSAQQKFALSVLITLIAFFVTILSIRAIKHPLHEVVQTAQQIASGDLTRDLESRFEDEIGQLLSAMQTMQVSLRRAFSEVLAATHTATITAAEIAQGSADLAQRTEEQAAALEETAASMEELTKTVQQSALNAERASQRVEAVLKQAEQSGVVTASAAAAMAEIEQSNRKIAKIISVIDDFAFQTNLLALNAAVEAARAGEKGQGFAVVATEVRKLASRSAESAQEIHRLVNDSMAKVNSGGQLVQQSGQMLQQIIAAVTEAHAIVAEIASAAREQAQGIEQINKAIAQMDQVTQRNAALVEETAAASQAMGEQAQALQRHMSFFKLGGQLRLIASSQTAALPPTIHPSAGGKGEGQMTGFIDWSEALSVGDSTIDQQHQKLVSIINKLHEAISAQRTPIKLKGLLNELVAYTQEHFRYEEQRMEAAHYPDVARHRALHTHLIQQVGVFYEKFQRGEPINMELMGFLKDWLLNHIQRVDKDYGPYLQRAPQ